MNVPQLLIISAVLVTLTYASYRDVRYRDIPEFTWLAPSIFVVSLNVYLGNYDLIHTAISLIPPISVLVLALLDMMGGADFFALFLVALAHPHFLAIPISLLTLGYSVILPVSVMVYYLVINLIHYREFRSVKCIEGNKWYLPILSRPIVVRDYFRSRFIYPLTIPEEEGFKCRSTFSLNDDEEKRIREKIKEALTEGSIKPGDLIWVTPGFPHIAFYLVGYLAAILTPQLMLLKLILGA